MNDTLKSVRPAHESDVAEIGRIQAQSMHESLVRALEGPLTVATTAQFDSQAFAQAWLNSIQNLPSPQHHVVVATDGEDVCGFAAFAPTEPIDLPDDQRFAPDAEFFDRERSAYEILNFDVDSGANDPDHGARLLAAVTDIVANSQGNEIYLWVFPTDDTLTRMLDGAGFAPRGLRRNFEVDAKEVTQHLWWTTL
ncbi:ribosomal protein S18 acetylase RimI-like enzyme [Arcanobacterium pluranimalium]|uniref:GNAT family N-acetyltransferase n=1 Tax=Arcanobacterium pluranimalium TaxID=108028 RepID=UPI001959DDC4|nr:hypothetical protein [Arcanobacterium pluranimalium]MBM7825631.1 ribosomal protein S18 acetylase RimI-like enzyme [Arcanobacterium pluranimalium]